MDDASSLLALTVDAIVASFGEQGLDVLQGRITEKFTEEVRKLPSPNRNSIMAAEIIDRGERAALIKGRIIEKSPERVVKKITSCPVADLGLSPYYCELMGYTAQGICKGVDDRLKFTSIRCMTKGDPYCEWIVERESSHNS